MLKKWARSICALKSEEHTRWTSVKQIAWSRAGNKRELIMTSFIEFNGLKFDILIGLFIFLPLEKLPYLAIRVISIQNHDATKEH